jgi:hypothetical protein
MVPKTVTEKRCNKNCQVTIGHGRKMKGLLLPLAAKAVVAKAVVAKAAVAGAVVAKAAAMAPSVVRAALLGMQLCIILLFELQATAHNRTTHCAS